MAMLARRTISIELFKFNSTWTTQDASRFKNQITKLRPASDGLDEQLAVGTKSLTTPIERSRGFQAAVIRYNGSQQQQHQQDHKEPLEHNTLDGNFEVQDRLKFDFELEDDDAIDIPKAPQGVVLAHIVCFKFRSEIPLSQINEFKHSVRNLRTLPCVLISRLVCHGPPLNAQQAQGYHLCLLSFHPGLAGLEAYQASKEHHDVTSRLMFPYIQELTRYDFII